MTTKLDSMALTSRAFSKRRLLVVFVLLALYLLANILISDNHKLSHLANPESPHYLFSHSNAQGSYQPAKPSCSVWPSWRTTIPSASRADDTALHASRLGLPEVLGGDSDQGCVPARDRLGPFGHSSGDKSKLEPDWTSLRWGQLQNDCAGSHFGQDDATPKDAILKLQRAPPSIDAALKDPGPDIRRSGRTAVVLRAWDQYDYYDNQLAWMRAMTTELSLDIGGRYQLFIVVDVKDQSIDLADDEKYAEVLERAVPEEFRDAALLFNEQLLRGWFPKVEMYTAHDQMYQALQVFSFTFPEFDYVWQLEMDARFTRNVAAMLDNADAWSRKQPRKNLWERNGRWYIPGLWNDSYSAFAAHVDNEIGDEDGIWGPPAVDKSRITPQGPSPPTRGTSAAASWGVDEPADLITFAPLIDPVGTSWTYEHIVHNFEAGEDLPRRMAIVSMTRTSRRLLHLISEEQRTSGAWVVSESTPETWSLLHGLKAVYVPHLLAFNFQDGEKSPEELDRMLHKGPPSNRAGGEQAGFLWCDIEIGLPERRWVTASYFFWAGDAPNVWWQYTNGSCTYPLLLHPVKHD